MFDSHTGCEGEGPLRWLLILFHHNWMDLSRRRNPIRDRHMDQRIIESNGLKCYVRKMNSKPLDGHPKNHARMTGLRLFAGNRLEKLAERLSLTVREPVRNPFEGEIIIVQSRGMERYLSMEMAGHNQITANCLFPFPHSFLMDLFRKFIPDIPEQAMFHTDSMIFKILKILPELNSRPEFKSLETYLNQDEHPLKEFQLAERIANLLDHYLVYRPDMIFQWEKGREKDLGKHQWQAVLWRKLIEPQPPYHTANLRELFFSAIQSHPQDMAALPERISLFGISYLPPLYIETFMALSRFMKVNMFVLNPCREYWFDIYSKREIRAIKQKSEQHLPEEDYHLDQGNSLLASMGGQGRNFFSLLYDYDFELIELYEDIQPRNLLSAIQSDILNLDHPEGAMNRGRIHDLAAGKEPSSIQIHSCHSPLREMESLYDYLLDLFERDRRILPKDIIVMTPDIEKYAPFIHIVFDTQADHALRIPYAIADQSARRESGIVEGLLSLISLKDSRWGLSRIMGILELPEVKARFEFSDPDLEKLEHWIQDINIKWGIDGEHRREMGLPAFSENTWRAGLDRLLLGYAMPGRNRDMYRGILPYDHIEGSDALILGRFIRFLNGIFDCKNLFNEPRTLSQWGREILQLLDRFFKSDDTIEDHFQLIRQVIGDLIQIEKDSGFHDPMDISVIYQFLEQRLQDKSFGYGFLSGGITFCAMLPMRSIPFKAVCLVGMDSGAFPRDSQTLGFDLINLHPRKGDRSRRNDDKYLFLESILSARKYLYISHVGQNIQDNSKIPPSTLVSELLDHIKKEYRASESRLMTEHRLQPFNPAYFLPQPALFSFSRENHAAAQSLLQEYQSNPFIRKALPDPPEESNTLTIQDLAEFFQNPARFFCRNRLGIHLGIDFPEKDDTENHVLKGLDMYRVEQEILLKHLDGSLGKNEKDIQRSSGVLPHGTVGDYFYGRSRLDVDRFVIRMKSLAGEEGAISLDADMSIDEFSIFGKLPNIYAGGMLLFRLGRFRPRDLVLAWILHLFLCTLDGKNVERRTTLLCKDSAWEFEPVKHPRETLKTLLGCFRKGLVRPLPFFPASSFDYARQKLVKDAPVSVALSYAQKRWLGNEFLMGEKDDPYLKLCFNRTEPLDRDFTSISETVFSELFAHARDIKSEMPN